MRIFENTEDRELLRASAFLAIHLLPFFLSAFAVYDTTARFYGGEHITYLYALIMFGIACGYLLFNSTVKWGVPQKVTIFASVAVIFSCAALIFLPKPLYPQLWVIFLWMAALGVTGAAAHLSIAMLGAGRAWTARAVGAGYFAALVAQYAIQHFITSQPAVQAAGLLLSSAAAVVIRPPAYWLSGAAETADPERPDAPDRRELATLIAIVAAMSILMGLCEGIQTNLHVHSKIDVASWPRLFYAGGVFAAGFAADYRRREFLPASTLCLLTLSVAAMFFMQTPATYDLSMALYYLYVGFYLVYITVVFTDIAPRTRAPALWASMGRAARSYALIPAVIFGTPIYERWGAGVLEMATLALYAVVVLLMAVREKFSALFAADAENKRLATSAERFGLSAREADVLKRWLADNNEQTAETCRALHISERTFYRDTAAIHEKTGAASKAEAIKFFREW